MATTENVGLMRFFDEGGKECILYPVTKTSGILADGPLDMELNRIQNLPDPVDQWDAVPKWFVENIAKSIADTYLKKAGGTMSGPLNMGQKNVQNLADPTEDGDAVSLAFVKSFLKDYIVEEGFSGNWFWIKLKNDMALCFGASVQEITIDKASGSFFYGSAVSIPYPFTFVFPPMELVSKRGGWGSWISNSQSNTESATAADALYSAQKRTASNYTFVYCVVGKWR